jgi:ubiquitin carboxyl-terminal hydrolase 7
MIEPMKAKQSLKAAELQDGDIVCFQIANDGKSASESKTSLSDRSIHSESDQLISRLTHQLTLTDDDRSLSIRQSADRIEDARMFYDFLLHKRLVRFHPHPTRNTNPDSYEPFNLTLSTKNSYDQVAVKVGDRLSVDPTHIRFWTVNATTGNPKASVKRSASQTLATILNPPYSTFSNNNQRQDALYFEILDISLSELDTKKALKVVWLSEGITKEDVYDLLVPKNGNVDDLVAALIKKAQLEDEAKAGPIRVYEVHSNKIHKDLPREHQVLSITDYVSVIAERIPAEEINAEGDLIQAFHFQNEPNKSHAIPFRFLVKQGEVFSETKKRLEKRTGLKGKNFEKIKFAVVKRSSYSKPQYLNDGKFSRGDDLLR